jgi:hypothetical protein
MEIIEEMFNILIDGLPKTVNVDAQEIEVNSDFRVFILFEQVLQDCELSKEDKIKKCLSLFYKEKPTNLVEAIEQMFNFYSMSFMNDFCTSNKSKGSKKNKNLYDWDFDQAYIYSAFFSQYRIDLQEIDYLHWWKFRFLFMGLDEENKISKIIGYRDMDTSKIKDKEEKKRYEQLKKTFAIPEKNSKEEIEKINNLEKALINGGDIASLL